MTNKIGIGLILVTLVVIVVNNFNYLFNQSIRLDEAQSIWVSTKSILTILKINGQDVQTPLYALLLHFWMNFWGTNIVMARVMSLLFFMLNIPFLYILAREVTDRSTAVLAVIIYALSPFTVWYGQEARAYSLLTWLVILNHLFFVRLLKSKDGKSWFGYLVTAVLGLYTHYFFIFLLVAQTIYLIGHFIRKYWRKKHLDEKQKYFIKVYVLLGLSIFVLFLPWIFYVYKLGSAANTQPLIPLPTSFDILQVYINFILGFQSRIITAIGVSLWPILLTILFLLFTRKQKIKIYRIYYWIAVSFLPVILVFLLSFYKPIFLPRYLIVVTPSLFIVLAWIILNFGGKLWSTLTLIILLVMLVFLNIQNSSNKTPVKEDYKDVVLYLTTHTKPQDIVVVTAPFTTFPIEYYYLGQAKVDTFPRWNRYVEGAIPPFSNNLLVQQTNNYKKIYNRMFLVLSYDQGYQGTIVNYMDHNYQLLTDLTYPANINLRVYQLRYDSQK